MKHAAIALIISLISYVVVMAAVQVLTFDLFIAAALVAASFLNRQAIYILAGHCAASALFYSAVSDVDYNSTVGMLMAISAVLFINLLYEIRQALLLTAGLFWLAAVDAYLFPITETIYYNSFSYLVGAVNLYVLYLLMGGRRHVARLIGAAQYWIFFWCNRILWASNTQTQEADKRN